MSVMFQLVLLTNNYVTVQLISQNVKLMENVFHKKWLSYALMIIEDHVHHLLIKYVQMENAELH